VLRELHIRNFAIIEELHLQLEPGFNILTGETGAGKSILIDAVALLLGGRADLTSIRRGEERALIEGMFVLSPTEQAFILPLVEGEGLEGERRDTLWLSRELRKSGRSVARVNGTVTSVSLLRKIAAGLVDIHGQSEHLSLLRIQEHLKLLDRFAGLEELRAEVAVAVRRIQSIRAELRALREGERERMQRLDLLRFQLEEIQAAHLQPGELQELEGERNRLANAEELAQLSSSVVSLLEEGSDEAPPVLDVLGQAERDMSALVRVDGSLSGTASALESAVYQLEDVARTLRDYLNEIEFNPRRLMQVQQRMALLNQLQRKYGRDIEEVLAYAEQAAVELETLEHSDERIVDLEEEAATLLVAAARQAERLSARRREAAHALSAGVEAELADLRMQGARFGVSFRWEAAPQGLPLESSVPQEIQVTVGGEQPQEGPTVERVAFDPTGMDRVEFLIAPNVGEGLKPMARIASGGETARLMLALKTVLSRADETPTLIFDEIDQGIGGRVGATVGTKLWRLTDPRSQNRHQVLCITHLPQLAGFGDSHFRVRKVVTEGRTAVRVERLQEPERLQELAQMLGTVGEAAHDGAREILEAATTTKELALEGAET
jgi:DNA repair protein RecN (Recombination protein N)